MRPPMFSEMEQMGIIPSALNCNLTQDEWREQELKRNEGRLSDNDTVIVSTGVYTGRSPKDRFIVKEKSNFSFTPLISKDEILGWSYGVGFEMENINDLLQKIYFGIMSGEISSYFLEYSKMNLDKKESHFRNADEFIKQLDE